MIGKMIEVGDNKMLKVITGYDASSYDGVFCPDAYMHPNDITDLASKLVLIGKCYNTTIITFNPMLIEAISLISRYCDMTVEQIEIFINDKKVSYDDMGIIYEELSRNYDVLDKIKAINLFAGKTELKGGE